MRLAALPPLLEFGNSDRTRRGNLPENKRHSGFARKPWIFDRRTPNFELPVSPFPASGQSGIVTGAITRISFILKHIPVSFPSLSSRHYPLTTVLLALNQIDFLCFHQHIGFEPHFLTFFRDRLPAHIFGTQRVSILRCVVRPGLAPALLRSGVIPPSGTRASPGLPR